MERRGVQTSWSLSDRLRYLWGNRPIADEATFVSDFRRHSFAVALVGTWASAIVGTINGVYRAAYFPAYAPIFGFIGGVSPNRVYQALLESLLLYWTVPLLFVTFKSWSRRNYQWILIAVYAFYWARTGNQIAGGYRKVDDATVSSVMLIVFTIIFLRIPFKHVLLLSVSATLLTEYISAVTYGKEAFRLIISSTLTLVLSLYTSWRMEERDRSVFEKRLRAQDAADEAQEQRRRALASAEEAQEQRRRAMEAAADAENHRAQAAMLAQEAQTQRRVAEGVAAQSQLMNIQITDLFAQRELLIRGLHHDAMNTLLVMGSMLLTLRQKVASDTSLLAIRPELDTLESGGEALGQLMSGMYDLVTLGNYAPHYEPVSVNSLLERTRRQFLQQARAKGLHLTVHGRKSDVFVRTDKAAIERILDNLVSNAIKYTSAGGVLVGAVRLGPTVRIDVCDTGIGIPKDKQDEIFKEFVRLGQSGEQKVPGHGLGLAIVALLRDKLRESGLYVEVGSPVCSAGSKYAQRFGIGGTRFSVSMQVSPSPAPSVTVVGSVPVDLSRVYVVVVEDNPQVLASICSVMRAAGYDVDQMVRTAACLAEVSRIFDLMPYWPPSLVVCDFRLGLEETANDVIRVLDERFAGTAPIPIIVYSAEIEPPVTATRPRVRVVVKSNDVTTLLRSMEEAVQDARREVPESAGDDGGSLAASAQQ